MAELLILFLVLICILLIVMGITYKCTDGTTNTEDFSFDKCFKFGENKTPEEVKKQEDEKDITISPLLSSGNGIMSSLIGSGSIDGDMEDVDYSSYIDYFTASKTPLKWRTEMKTTRKDGKNVETLKFNDRVEVSVTNGLGECAKKCYDQDVKIGDKSCNAFHINPSKTSNCFMYWSQTSASPPDQDGQPTTHDVYRLRSPKGAFEHEALVEEAVLASDDVYFFKWPNYKRGTVGKSPPAPSTWNAVYTKTIGTHNLLNGPYYSYIGPDEFCMHGWSGINGTGVAHGSLGGVNADGTQSEYDIMNPLNRNIGSYGIRSVKIGKWNGSWCDFADAPAGENTLKEEVDVSDAWGAKEQYCLTRNGRDEEKTYSSGGCKDIACGNTTHIMYNSLNCLRGKRERCCELRDPEDTTVKELKDASDDDDPVV